MLNRRCVQCGRLLNIVRSPSYSPVLGLGLFSCTYVTGKVNMNLPTAGLYESQRAIIPLNAVRWVILTFQVSIGLLSIKWVTQHLLGATVANNGPQHRCSPANNRKVLAAAHCARVNAVELNTVERWHDGMTCGASVRRPALMSVVTARHSATGCTTVVLQQSPGLLLFYCERRGQRRGCRGVGTPR